jgi:hypothetical protein
MKNRWEFPQQNWQTAWTLYAAGVLILLALLVLCWRTALHCSC